MCCGWSPFYAEDTQQMYRNICFGKIKFPRGAIGDDGKQFVKGVSTRCCGRPTAGLSMQS
jgi:protein-serine/threonine kinase